MGFLRIKANECKSKENDTSLKEQFIYGKENNAIMAEIIREVTAVKITSKITSEQVLA